MAGNDKIPATYVSPTQRRAFAGEDHPRIAHRFGSAPVAEVLGEEIADLFFPTDTDDKERAFHGKLITCSVWLDPTYDAEGKPNGPPNGFGWKEIPRFEERWTGPKADRRKQWVPYVLTPFALVVLQTKALGRAMKAVGYPDDSRALAPVLLYKRRLREIAALERTGGAEQIATLAAGAGDDIRQLTAGTASADDGPPVGVDPDSGEIDDRYDGGDDDEIPYAEEVRPAPVAPAPARPAPAPPVAPRSAPSGTWPAEIAARLDALPLDAREQVVGVLAAKGIEPGPLDDRGIRFAGAIIAGHEKPAAGSTAPKANGNGKSKPAPQEPTLGLAGASTGHGPDVVDVLVDRWRALPDGPREQCHEHGVNVIGLAPLDPTPIMLSDTDAAAWGELITEYADPKTRPF